MTLSHKVWCVNFYSIFKTIICLPVFYLTLLQFYVLKTFCFISTCQWQYDPRQLCVYCSITLLRPVIPTSIMLHIVKTYVCITIFTFLRHALLCVQWKNDKFFNECVKYWNFFETLSLLYIFQTSVHKIMFYILKTESKVKCINDSFFKPKQGILLVHHELDWHQMFNHLKHFDILHGLG